MLDEIRTFFEELRQQPAPLWPEGVPVINPATGEDLRAVSELHWRLQSQCADELEAKIIGLYEAGADNTAAIGIFDEVVAIVRRKTDPHEVRVKEIGRLMKARGSGA